MTDIVSHSGVNAMVPSTMEGAMKLAEMMSRGKLVPTHLQGQPADCLMVIEMAMRMGMSPFAVAQCTSVIQGRLMLEGKLVSAALNGSGILATRLREEFSGEGASLKVVLRGTLKGETQPREVTVSLSEAKTNNSMWTKQPQQQLIYFATRAWARRHAPEVMLGVYSPEEFDDPKRDTFAGTTIEAKAEATPAPKPLTVTEWLKILDADLASAATPEEIDAILAGDNVQQAQDKLRGADKDRLQHITDAAIRRAQEMETSAPNEDAEAA
jgi:RecT family